MPTTKVERLEAKYKETCRLIERAAKRLDDAERIICTVVPMLNRLRRAGDRQLKAIREAKREAKRKPAAPEPGMNDAIGF